VRAGWVSARPERLQVAWEKPVEGHPDEAGQARMQMSRHANGGALAGPKEHVPARVLWRTAPGEITCPNAEGTLAGWTDPGRRARCCPALSIMSGTC
jgi:hypothetical protein